ncbi:TrmB family transcriptional regulator [Candidatus Woesearchaeota archaeon]|nr:TrmB family transcriptional regulator [Candidatus Woesearchaeota archaeon]
MELKNLGLSDYEQRAYETLVKLGKASASDISRNANVSYGKIYEVLASLEHKGLVRVVPEKAKKFIPTDPANLIRLIDRKEDELKQTRKKISELKKFYDIQEKEAVEVVKGQRNFYKIIRAMKHPKQFKYTIKYTSEFNPEWVREDKKLTAEGVELKCLVRYDPESENNVRAWLKINPHIKKIKNTGVAIDIRESEIVITLIKNNTIILIKDDALVKIMKELFKSYYDSAESIGKPIKTKQTT